MARDELLLALHALRLGPILLLVYALAFVFAKPAQTASGPITQVVVQVTRPRTAAILSLLSLAAATYFLDGIVIVLTALWTHVWEGHTKEWQGIESADIAGLAAFTALLIIGTVKQARGIDIWTRKALKVFVLLAITFDIPQTVLVVLTARLESSRSDDPHVPEQPPVPDTHVSNILHLSTIAARLLVLVPLLAVLSFPRVEYVPTNVSDEPVTHQTSTSYLLPPSPTRTAYGTFHNDANGHSQAPSGTVTPVPSEQGQGLNGLRQGPLKPTPKKEVVDPDPTWSEIGRRLRRVLPFLWPSRSPKLLLLVFVCTILVAAGRFINVGIPFSLGKTVANLETYGRPDPTARLSPWPPLLIYVALRFSSSAVTTIVEVLWQPVMQYSDRAMAQLSFNHILNLSLHFHTHRKTGEVLRILDRGSAINHVFELLLFFIAPTFLDITVGLVAFYIKFEATLALVICAVFVAYITASITLTGARTKLRRRMNDADVVTRGIHTDCLLNYETVKYFGNEVHEQQRYRDSVIKYQSLEFKVMAYLNLLNIVQNSIISLGLLAGSIIVALRVTRGEAKSSDFIIFITYLAQLYGPLNQLGYIYRSLNSSLVDTEKLLKLLDEPVDIKDKPGAPDIHITDGEIEFENVSFSYDGVTPALKGVSFKIPKGSSVALVGQTGSGKSTALRLLYRFYDLAPGQGRILIDGQDIRDVTQTSLRKAIGVVPQDSVLFNSTIEYNIKYGKLDAQLDEIVAAAKAAQMHDRILSFPDGYQTTVGERGVRLSGGEKQRVAIARTLLKNPPILLLDEATSALDTTTERDIQNALQNLMQGRSSLSIAHRLSTIAAADLILVLKDGQIIESGNIRDLIALNGDFAAMWSEQVKTDEDAQLLASVSGDTKEMAHVPASVKDEPTSGCLLDDPVPAEAEAVAAILPSAAIEAEQEVEAVPAAGTEVPEDAVALTEEPESIPAATAPEQPQPADAEAERTAPVESADAEPERADATPAVAFPSGGSTSALGEEAPLVASPPDMDAAPISFPAATADDASSRREGSFSNTPTRPGTHGASISFGPEVERPPSRVGTPEVDESQQKRKRTASQNLQNLSKFAKRMSLGRRQNSNVSTPLDAGATSPTPPRSSVETPVSPSPTASVDEGSTSRRGSRLLKRKDTTTATTEDDKPPPRRRTTLSFSKPKQPKPAQT